MIGSEITYFGLVVEGCDEVDERCSYVYNEVAT